MAGTDAILRKIYETIWRLKGLFTRARWAHFLLQITNHPETWWLMGQWSFMHLQPGQGGVAHLCSMCCQMGRRDWGCPGQQPPVLAHWCWSAGSTARAVGSSPRGPLLPKGCFGFLWAQWLRSKSECPKRQEVRAASV